MTYRFGPFELEPEAYRLKRGESEVPIEPKVLELLVYLIRQDGRTVSKDELVREVWSGLSVTDSALSRCVYQARQTLADEDTRWIATVHGRGYRFAGEVEEVLVAVDQAPAVVGASGPSGPRPNRALGLALLAAVLGLAVAASYWLVRSGEPEPSDDAPITVVSVSEEPADTPVVAIVGFTGSGTDEVLVGLSLADLVHERLRTVQGLIVRAPDYRAAMEASSLEAVARQKGATVVLAGSVRSSLDPDRVEVVFDLYETGTTGGRLTPLGSYSLPRLRKASGLERFVELREAIVGRVLELLGPVLSPATIASARTPKIAEAYRLYLLAYQRLLDDFCAGSGPAIELLERSLETDPQFSPAWLYLGVSYSNQVWACGADSSALGLAMEAVDEAIRLDPTWAKPRLMREALLIETGRVEEAYEQILELLAAHPTDPGVLNGQFYALRFAGFLDRSAALMDRTLAIDPLLFENGATGGAPATFLYLGRIDRFLATLPTLDMPYFRYYRGFAEHTRGQEKAARSALEPAFRINPADLFGRMSHALMAIMEGEPEQARSIVESICLQRDALGSRDGEITYKQAQLFALAGDPDRALDELAKAVEQGFFCHRCFGLDPTLAGLRRDPKYTVVVERAADRHRAFARRFGLEPEAVDTP